MSDSFETMGLEILTDKVIKEYHKELKSGFLSAWKQGRLLFFIKKEHKAQGKREQGDGFKDWCKTNKYPRSTADRRIKYYEKCNDEEVAATFKSKKEFEKRYDMRGEPKTKPAASTSQTATEEMGVHQLMSLLLSLHQKQTFTEEDWSDIQAIKDHCEELLVLRRTAEREQEPEQPVKKKRGRPKKVAA